MTEDKNKTKVKVIPLGGLNEIGKNMTVIEQGNDIIVIDCGMTFPEEEMLGIDIVIPDTTYLTKNSERIKGIVLTHGHEDHIGALPYVLQQIGAPVYGTKLTLGLVRNKLAEFNMEESCRLEVVEIGNVIKLGSMTVEFIRTSHSIADLGSPGDYHPCRHYCAHQRFQSGFYPNRRQNDRPSQVCGAG